MPDRLVSHRSPFLIHIQENTGAKKPCQTYRKGTEQRKLNKGLSSIKCVKVFSLCQNAPGEDCLPLQHGRTLVCTLPSESTHFEGSVLNICSSTHVISSIPDESHSELKW